jgi:hypothetical protein
MAQARKVRDSRFPRAVFEVPIDEAVALLIRSNQIETGDEWSFHVSGDVLQITRTRAPIEDPIDPENASAGQGRG